MRELLQEVLDRIPGALGASVVGLDGLLVEKATARDDVNIDLASAEGIGLVKRAIASPQAREGEPPDEISIAWGTRMTILRALGPDYYLCVLIDAEAIPGRARFEAWRAGQQLREAIR